MASNWLFPFSYFHHGIREWLSLVQKKHSEWEQDVGGSYFTRIKMQKIFFSSRRGIGVKIHSQVILYCAFKSDSKGIRLPKKKRPIWWIHAYCLVNWGKRAEPTILIQGGGIRLEVMVNGFYQKKKKRHCNLLAFGQICDCPRGPECFGNVLQLVLKFDN